MRDRCGVYRKSMVYDIDDGDDDYECTTILIVLPQGFTRDVMTMRTCLHNNIIFIYIIHSAHCRPIRHNMHE